MADLNLTPDRKVPTSGSGHPYIYAWGLGLILTEEATPTLAREAAKSMLRTLEACFARQTAREGFEAVPGECYALGEIASAGRQLLDVADDLDKRSAERT